MKIVFICTGNTCRSPMAEGYLKSFFIPSLTVLSRGLCADGSAVSDNAKSVMKKAGININDHISKNFSESDKDADLFICMSESHKSALENYGIPKDKITVLGGGISDPFGCGEDIYLKCRNEIFTAIDNMVFGGKLFSFKVEKATEDDADAIAELERQTSAEPWSKNGILDSMSASTLFFVAKQNNKIIGYIGFTPVSDEGYITNVAVFKEYRKKGVATLLLNRIINEAVLKNLSFVSLEVRVSNKDAISLYNRLSFKKEGLRKAFYRNPTEDAIIMTRRF